MAQILFSEDSNFVEKTFNKKTSERVGGLGYFFYLCIEWKFKNITSNF
jgi:hypothetical protein